MVHLQINVRIPTENAERISIFKAVFLQIKSFTKHLDRNMNISKGSVRFILMFHIADMYVLFLFTFWHIYKRLNSAVLLSEQLKLLGELL